LRKEPVYLHRDDLHLGGTLTALAGSPDSRRTCVGRGLSTDQFRENLAVLGAEPGSGTVLDRRLLPDSDAPSRVLPLPNPRGVGAVAGGAHRSVPVILSGTG
jgi:hypothetical protein